MIETPKAARRLRLRDLHTLQAVIETRGMGRAASRLAMTQSAVSKAIGALERELGVVVLERGARGVEPTEHGRILAEHGVAMLDELDQGLRRLAHLQDPGRGELRIGMPEPLMALAARVIERVSRRHPRTCFTIVTDETVTLLRQLRDRTVDLVLSRMPSADAAPDLATEVLFHDALGVIAGRDNKWVRRRSLRLADLLDEPWIFSAPNAFLRPYVDEAFHASGLPLPHITVVTKSIHMRNCLLAGGRFLTIHPRALVHLAGSRGILRLLPLELPVAPHPICLVSLRKRAATPLAGVFAAEIRLAIQRLAGRTP